MRALVVVVVLACSGCAQQPFLEGAGLHLFDTAHDGTGLAYADRFGTLSFADPRAPVGGGEQIGTLVDDAHFHAGILVGEIGLSADGTVAASACARTKEGLRRTLGPDVRTSSLTATPDSAHLFFETIHDAVAGTRDLWLDEGIISSGAQHDDAHFSLTGERLALGVDKIVRTYGDDGIHVLATSKAATANAITHDGARVIYGANDSGNVVALEIQSSEGGDPALLAEHADDTRFVITDDDTEVVYLSAGAIFVVGLDGTNGRSVKASGAVDIVAERGGEIVYVSAVDAATGLLSLGVVDKDGAHEDKALGTAASDEHFSTDGSFYLWKDSVVAGIGRLRIFDVATHTSTTVAESVGKAQWAGDTVVYLDSTQHLFRAVRGHTPEQVQFNVDTFDVLGTETSSPKIAYSIRANANAGIWLTEP